MTALTDIRKRSLVVIQRNPVSGSGRGRDELLHCVTHLKRHALQVRMFHDRDRLDAYVQQPDNAARLRCLVAAGGDGTVADLMNRHAGVPLAVFPMGTENLVAKYLGVPRDGQAIARTIVDAHSLVLDAARANGRSFLLMLSAGVDAEVVRRMHAIRKGNIHKLQYAWPVVSSLIGTATHRILATSADGQYEAEGSHVIVTNIPAYGFGFQFSPDAQPDDGLLDVRVFRPDSRISVMSHVVTMRVLPQLAERDVIRFRCSELLLSTPESGATIPAQADGDPFPALPLNIAVQPKRLHLLVPRKSPFAAGQGRAQLSNL